MFNVESEPGVWPRPEIMCHYMSTSGTWVMSDTAIQCSYQASAQPSVLSAFKLFPSTAWAQCSWNINDSSIWYWMCRVRLGVGTLTSGQQTQRDQCHHNWITQRAQSVSHVAPTILYEMLKSIFDSKYRLGSFTKHWIDVLFQFIHNIYTFGILKILHNKSINDLGANDIPRTSNLGLSSKSNENMICVLHNLESQ